LRFRHCPALGLQVNEDRTKPLCCLCWFGSEFFCDLRLLDSTTCCDGGEPLTIVKKPISQICDFGYIRTTVVVHAKNIVYYERFQFHLPKRMESRRRSSLCTTTSHTGPETYVKTRQHVIVNDQLSTYQFYFQSFESFFGLARAPRMHWSTCIMAIRDPEVPVQYRTWQVREVSHQ
jgi:hypothetical protein